MAPGIRRKGFPANLACFMDPVSREYTENFHEIMILRQNAIYSDVTQRQPPAPISRRGVGIQKLHYLSRQPR